MRVEGGGAAHFFEGALVLFSCHGGWRLFGGGRLLERKRLCEDKQHLMKAFFLSAVLMMGFTESEARLGLRACQGDTTLAIDYITTKRQVSSLSVQKSMT